MKQQYIDDNIEEFQDEALKFLLGKIYKHYGFDFRNYSWNLLKMRITIFMYDEGIKTIACFDELVFKDSILLDKFFQVFSNQTTAMFRDPDFYLTVRRKIIPLLRTYPTIRIWVAGCATGEEAYSLAILLQEENLYQRSIIYATDINEVTLKKAREAVVPCSKIDIYNNHYLQAGGQDILTRYCTKHDQHYIINDNLKKNVVFALHNLVTDKSFNEFNLVMCRNVLIYFNQTLKNQVYRLLYESMSIFGILALGSKESLMFSAMEYCYETLDDNQKLYKKVR